MKLETEAARTARKIRAREFLKDHAGRGAKQEFFRAVAERNSGADQIVHPPSSRRRNWPRDYHIGNLVTASTRFGKLLLDESRKTADVPIHNRSVGEPPVGLDVSGLLAVIDASVFFNSDIVTPSWRDCSTVVELIEAGKVELCITPAIIREISRVAKIRLPLDQTVKLREVTIDGAGRQRLKTLMEKATKLLTKRNMVPLSEFPLEDLSDGMYAIARQSFEERLGRPVVLVSRDHHLLDLEDRSLPTADRRILHPIAFIELCMALGILGQG